MKKLFYIPILLILFASCKKDPIPCIEVDNASPAVGTLVTFNSCSEKTISLEWFMAGPAGAPENTMGWSEIQFSHAFTVAGSYTITLNAYNDFSFLGDMQTTTTTISVN